MIKYDLREQGFSEIEKTNKKFVITVLWVFFTVLMVAGAILLIAAIVGYAVTNQDTGKDASSPIASGGDLGSARQGITFLLFYFTDLIGALAIYFAAKFLLTFLVCQDSYKSIRFKLLEDSSLPVCHCKEALTVGQIMLIYLVPVVAGYAILVGWCAYQVFLTDMRSSFIFTFMFISFFMAFDLTLAVHVLYMKIKEKADYISIDRHVYVMTLYKGTYVKFNKKDIRKKHREMYKVEKGEFAKIFTKMTTCGNPKCDNYGMELEQSEEICPVCREKSGKFAYVFTKMKSCINSDCENYGQELEADREKCPLCGEQTGKFALKLKKHLAAPAIVIALASVFAYAFIDWFTISYNITGSVLEVIALLKMIISVISICMGISGKSKPSVIIPIVCAVSNFYIGTFLWMAIV